MSIFEVIMLLCFGAAWPSSIYKSYISRTSKGKSGVFLIIIFTGYISGILHKAIYNPDWVIVLYSLNALMVFLDILLYTRNSALDRQIN
ncbi:MAG TPA: hypothetical protein ENN05_13310 [Deltaproteobacteria bacterium]|nr:hypothetical protein [Deltaproteobacteria bacterium]